MKLVLPMDKSQILSTTMFLGWKTLLSDLGSDNWKLYKESHPLKQNIKGMPNNYLCDLMVCGSTFFSFGDQPDALI